MTTWYFRLSRLLEASNVKKRTKNHSADADRIFMLVKNHVLAVSGMGDEAPSTPGGRNGGRDVPSLWTARAIWWESLYRGNLPEGKRSVPQAELLEQLYQKFNCAHPTDYHGHSLSVSDVIMLNQNGKILAHYVDSIGFKELPGFLDKKQERPSVLLNLKEKCDAPECNPIVCRKARDGHEL